MPRTENEPDRLRITLAVAGFARDVETAASADVTGVVPVLGGEAFADRTSPRR